MTVSTDSKLSLVSRVGEWQTVPRKLQAVSLSRRPLRLLIEFLAERFGGALAPWDRELRRPWPRSVKASRKPT